MEQQGTELLERIDQINRRKNPPQTLDSAMNIKVGLWILISTNPQAKRTTGRYKRRA